MGFTYPDKFTYLNTFVMQVAQRCSDNGGPTVSLLTSIPTFAIIIWYDLQSLVSIGPSVAFSDLSSSGMSSLVGLTALSTESCFLLFFFLMHL